MNAETIIEKLGLVPLPEEGGYFRETYRSGETIGHSALDSRYSSSRSHSTAIYYLLTVDDFSALHRITSDEIFHFYAGDPVDMLQLRPDGSYTLITIGKDIEAGEAPQVVAPKSVWQGCRLKPEGEWALLGTTVAPGFDYEDFELGDRDDLIHHYPQCEVLIREFTREME